MIFNREEKKKGKEIKREEEKHNPIVSPFGSALIKKWQIKLGDAGTIVALTVSIPD